MGVGIKSRRFNPKQRSRIRPSRVFWLHALWEGLSYTSLGSWGQWRGSAGYGSLLLVLFFIYWATTAALKLIDVVSGMSRAEILTNMVFLASFSLSPPARGVDRCVGDQQHRVHQHVRAGDGLHDAGFRPVWIHQEPLQHLRQHHCDHQVIFRIICLRPRHWNSKRKTKCKSTRNPRVQST